MGVFRAAVAGAMSVVDSDMGSSSGRNEWFKILVDLSGDAPSLPGPVDSARLFSPNAPLLGYRVSRAAIPATCLPWKRARASSFAEGNGDPPAAGIVWS